MKTVFRVTLLLLGVFGIALASPVQAVGLFQDCSQPGDDAGFSYTCLDEATCLSLNGGPAGSCGLGAPAEAVCCKKPLATSGPSAPVQCTDQGGSCRLQCDPNEKSIGQFNCLTGYACCKSSQLLQEENLFNCPTDEPCTTPATGGAQAPAGTGAGTGGTDAGTQAQPSTGEGGVPIQQSPDRLVLPACVSSGNCTLNDIVQAGVNFATFIMGLSGALFFAVFIYGGALYLLSFGNKSRVQKGKDAIKGAVIGMIFVLGAWTIVNTLVKGLKGESSTTTAPTKCEAQGAGYSCVALTGSTSQAAVADGEAKGYSCKTGLCPGAVNVLCCKLK
jgi:hypothetical protein